MAEVATLLAWLVCCLIWGLSMGALRSKYATDSWQMLHVTRGTWCHHWGQLGITGPLSDSQCEDHHGPKCGVVWHPSRNLDKSHVLMTLKHGKGFLYSIRILKIQVFFKSIYTLCLYSFSTLCVIRFSFFCKKSWSLSIEDVGCRGRRLFSIDDPVPLTEQVFGGFREQQGRKGNRFESTQIQFI